MPFLRGEPGFFLLNATKAKTKKLRNKNYKEGLEPSEVANRQKQKQKTKNKQGGFRAK